MKLSCAALFAVAAVVALLVMGEAQVAQAVTCSPSELISCAPAFTSSQAPTTTCCAKLDQQQPCFCQYINDPSLRQYVNSPNAHRVATTCHVSLPTKC